MVGADPRPQRLDRPLRARGVRRLRLLGAAAGPAAPRHDGDRRRHGRTRLVAGLPPRPPPALADRRLVTRLLRGVPRGAVLLPGPRAPDPRARHRPPVQHRVQAGNDRRAAAAAGRRLRLRRGLRAPRPTPALFAVAATAFLFFNGDPGTDATAQGIAFNQHIAGGSLASSLAGEYSFTLALAFALAFLGTLASALRTGRRLWIPALLLAATVMSHLVVAIFAAIGALVVWLASRPTRTIWRAVAIGGVGALLTAVWLLPLGVGAAVHDRHALHADHRVRRLPLPRLPLRGAVRVAVGVGRDRADRDRAHRRHRRPPHVDLRRDRDHGLLWLVFRFWEDLQATTAWNLRFLPFWYLGVFLLLGLGGAELVRGAAWQCALGCSSNGGRASRPASSAPRLRSRSPLPCRVGALVSIDDGKSFLPFWTRWNYRGYEDIEGEGSTPPKQFDEYRAFIDTAAALPPGRLPLGGQHPAERVRLAARADAAAVLDERTHLVDGGRVLRGVGDVRRSTSWPPPRSRRPATRRGRCEASRTGPRRTSRSACAGSRSSASATCGPFVAGEGEGRCRSATAARDHRARPRPPAARTAGPSTTSPGRASSPPCATSRSSSTGSTSTIKRSAASGSSRRASTPRACISTSGRTASASRGSTIRDALDRPLVDDGPAAWQRASTASARAARRSCDSPRSACPTCARPTTRSRSTCRAPACP